MSHRDQLVSMFNAGVSAVGGKTSVISAFEHPTDFMPDMIIAVGKAASGMCLGAHAVFGDDIPALVVTKYDHSDADLIANAGVEIMEAGHPIPDENSLLAGKKLCETIAGMSSESNLLMLVSGGASSIAEYLSDNLSLEKWQLQTREMISTGLAIEQINQKRKAVSRIKGGRLLGQFGGKRVISCAISDVEGDHMETIGSGIGDINLTHAQAEVRLIASNKIARSAVADKAIALNYEVKQNIETLYKDVFVLSKEIGHYLYEASPGIYIWGGEPTIALPPNPGNGGRNQSLALALAKEISGTDHISILVAGTDGTDGPTNAAGAIVDGATFRDKEAAQSALDQANGGDYLGKVGDLLITGPTGTNVMDLVIALVE